MPQQYLPSFNMYLVSPKVLNLLRLGYSVTVGCVLIKVMSLQPCSNSHTEKYFETKVLVFISYQNHIQQQRFVLNTVCVLLGDVVFSIWGFTLFLSCVCVTLNCYFLLAFHVLTNIWKIILAKVSLKYQRCYYHLV